MTIVSIQEAMKIATKKLKVTKDLEYKLKYKRAKCFYETIEPGIYIRHEIVFNLKSKNFFYRSGFDTSRKWYLLKHDCKN